MVLAIYITIITIQKMSLKKFEQEIDQMSTSGEKKNSKMSTSGENIEPNNEKEDIYNVPSPELVEKHIKAMESLKDLLGKDFPEDKPDNHVDIIIYSKDHLINPTRVPKKLSSHLENLKRIIDSSPKKEGWNDVLVDGTQTKKLTQREAITKNYNKSMNYCRQHMTGFFQDILKRTKQGTNICWSKGEERKRQDVVFGEMTVGLRDPTPRENKPTTTTTTDVTSTAIVAATTRKPNKVLKVKKVGNRLIGGRVYFPSDEPEVLLQQLLVGLENPLELVDCSSKQLNFSRPEENLGCLKLLRWSGSRQRFENLCFKLMIPLQGWSDEDNCMILWEIASDSNSIKNHLGIAGKGERALPHPFNERSMDLLRISYPLYHKYQDALQNAIIRCIDQKFSDPSFKWQSLPCCRLNPVCSGLTFCRKPYEGEKMGDVRCIACNMDLCPNGCGRAGHGGACDITTDEASEQVIRENSKPCPGCQTPVQKSEGCNHMTCRCGVQFCYHCGESYQRDERGHYMVTEHYQSDRCTQFPR